MAPIETASTAADRALMLASRAWGGPDPEAIVRRFAPSRRASLMGAWSRTSTEEARERLRRDHHESARPDFARVHPSWFVRALRGESAAVRGTVTSHAPGPIRDALAREFPTPGPARGADPEAVEWALALWAERLVGDLGVRADDPTVVVVLTRLRLREVARLVKVCGQVKHVFAMDGRRPSGADETLVRMTAADRVRIGFFRRLIGRADPRLAPAARADLGAIGGDRARGHSRVGLLTLGRLLGEAEPHRARWAMQHLPYPIVKRIREKAESPLAHRSLVAWESWVLEAAWARLLTEGRMVGPRGDGP